MREMANSNGPLLIHVGEEGTLVIHAEGKDAMLVGEGEGGAEDGAVGGLGGWVQG